ncbi:unnamed protein product [Meloidogyne enterolobii]|uniref:Uncharacterized protein n=1 Tax=Meloidogyne enterolobii TaxID=390850 RepID=A0ACB0Y8Z1_MELEN
MEDFGGNESPKNNQNKLFGDEASTSATKNEIVPEIENEKYKEIEMNEIKDNKNIKRLTPEIFKENNYKNIKKRKYNESNEKNNNGKIKKELKRKRTNSFKNFIKFIKLEKNKSKSEVPV